LFELIEAAVMVALSAGALFLAAWGVRRRVY